MKGRSSIRYIHTSKKEFKKTDNRVNVSLPVITDSRFKSAGNVRHVKSTVIPLIVFNSWDYRYECEVGQPLIIENLPRFIQASVIAESRRSGTFGIDSVSNDSGLTLEIAVDSLSAKGPYSNIGFASYLLFVFLSHRDESAGPGVAYSRFHYRLSRAEATILESTVSSSTSLTTLSISPISKFHEGYRANLVECLGDTFRKNTEKIIARINLLLKK